MLHTLCVVGKESKAESKPLFLEKKVEWRADYVAPNSYVHAKQYTLHTKDTLYTTYTVHTTLHTVHTSCVCRRDYAESNKIMYQPIRDELTNQLFLLGPKHYSSQFELGSGRVSYLEIQRLTVVH